MILWYYSVIVTIVAVALLVLSILFARWNRRQFDVAIKNSIYQPTPEFIPAAARKARTAPWLPPT